MNPKDYNLPHTEWRPHQREALELILNMHNPETLILEFPTGGGKSALSSAAGYTDGTFTMVATRDLQRQYADVYDFDVIWGRSHYPCTDENKVNRWKKTYGFPPNAGDCTAMKECTISCPYKQAKVHSYGSSKVVTNYHYAWYSEWWHKRPGYLFCDEAHNLAISTISSLAQLRVSERQKDKWELPKFPACSGTTEWAKDNVYDWLDKAIAILGGKLGSMEESKEKSQGTMLHRKLVMLRQLLPYGDWWVSGHNTPSIKNPPQLVCRPINPSAFADRLVGHHTKRVLMSATIGDAEMLASELGITDYTFHSFPHNIPADQRPVFLTDAPAMSYKSTYADYERQADVIGSICHRHKGERVLIHTTRWKHARDLANRLSKRGLHNRIYVPKQGENRLTQVAKLMNPTPRDMIAIGPSFWEGLDLKEDLCRCVIVAKIPFQDRSDPVVAARLRQEGGGKWDRWVAALKVTQGLGRAVRDETDYAIGYIADGNWERVSKYAPSWLHVQ